MEIIIDEIKYSVEECYKTITGVSNSNSKEMMRNNIFDEYGNYCFITDLKLETPNSAMNFGLNNYQEIVKGKEKQ